jgi:hypothetical protein
VTPPAPGALAPPASRPRTSQTRWVDVWGARSAGPLALRALAPTAHPAARLHRALAPCGVHLRGARWAGAPAPCAATPTAHPAARPRTPSAPCGVVLWGAKSGGVPGRVLR